MNCPDDAAIWPACAGEPVEPWVARHLRDCSGCQRRVRREREAISVLRTAASRLEGVHAGPLEVEATCNERIGPYAVLGRLGAGGQSVVYRAWHPRLQCEVAIKRQRFQTQWPADAVGREAHFLAELRHPTLPRAIDFGSDGDGHYLVFELIRGTPVSLLSKHLSVRDIAVLLDQLTAALEELHAFDVLHLDVSPGNVMVDEARRCRLIDLGLSRRPGMVESEAAGGTPGFAAPEALCAGLSVDARTDVFSVGALGRFLLNGGRSDSSGGSTTSEDFRADRELRRRLDCACRKAMALEPQSRWSSMRDFREALHVALRSNRSAAQRLAPLALCFGLSGGDIVSGPTAQASVWVDRGTVAIPLEVHGARKLDRLCFEFATRSESAALAIRFPGGSIVNLRPFSKCDGLFHFPRHGGAELRGASGTYVACFAEGVDAIQDKTRRRMQNLVGEIPELRLSAGECCAVGASSMCWHDRVLSTSEAVIDRWKSDVQAVCDGKCLVSVVAFYVQ